MKTTITTFDGVPYTMSLERTDDKYVLTFTCQRLYHSPQVEVHKFEDFTTAWEHYANNHHYYTNVHLEPLSEEAFLGLKPGTLYGHKPMEGRYA